MPGVVRTQVLRPLRLAFFSFHLHAGEGLNAYKQRLNGLKEVFGDKSCISTTQEGGEEHAEESLVLNRASVTSASGRTVGRSSGVVQQGAPGSSNNGEGTQTTGNPLFEYERSCDFAFFSGDFNFRCMPVNQDYLLQEDHNFEGEGHLEGHQEHVHASGPGSEIHHASKNLHQVDLQEEALCGSAGNFCCSNTSNCCSESTLSKETVSDFCAVGGAGGGAATTSSSGYVTSSCDEEQSSSSLQDNDSSCSSRFTLRNYSTAKFLSQPRFSSV
eukprot:GSA120T00010012001.1